VKSELGRTKDTRLAAAAMLNFLYRGQGENSLLHENVNQKLLLVIF